MKDGVANHWRSRRYEKFSIQTQTFALNFEVGDDWRLYQRAKLAADTNGKLLRTDDAYPQAGDGYIWEPWRHHPRRW